MGMGEERRSMDWFNWKRLSSLGRRLRYVIVPSEFSPRSSSFMFFIYTLSLFLCVLFCLLPFACFSSSCSSSLSFSVLRVEELSLINECNAASSSCHSLFFHPHGLIILRLDRCSADASPVS